MEGSYANVARPGDEETPITPRTFARSTIGGREPVGRGKGVLESREIAQQVLTLGGGEEVREPLPVACVQGKTHHVPIPPGTSTGVVGRSFTACPLGNRGIP